MTTATTKLAPLHRSRLPRVGDPKGLSKTELPDEIRLLIETEALEIFSSMVNSGRSLQSTLAAIYLSGMAAAHEAMK